MNQGGGGIYRLVGCVVLFYLTRVLIKRIISTGCIRSPVYYASSTRYKMRSTNVDLELGIRN